MYSKLFLSIVVITFLSLSSIMVIKAASEEDVEQLNSETDSGFNNLADEYPLIVAAIDGDVAVIQELIQDGADVNFQNENGWTATIAAIENAHYEALLKLIELEADLNIQEGDGWTGLMFAAFHGDIDMVEAILSNNGSPLIANNQGAYAHTIARNQNHIQVYETLIDYSLQQAMLVENIGLVVEFIQEGAPIDFQNEAGWTPLILAVALNAYDEANTLIELGASIHLAENDGWTPLIFAANNGFKELTSLLLSKGSDVSHANVNGTTALQYAINNNFDDIVELFSQYTTEAVVTPTETVSSEETVVNTEAKVVDSGSVEDSTTEETTETQKGEKKKGLFNW